MFKLMDKKIITFLPLKILMRTYVTGTHKISPIRRKDHMGHVVRKPVFGVSDQAMLLPDCSVTDTTTSYNVEIMLKEVKIFCRSDCVC